MMLRRSKIARTESATSRIARAVAFIGLMASCVPPGGTWPSQYGGGYQAQPQQSTMSGDEAGGEYNNEYNNEYSGGYNGSFGGGGGGSNCSSVCSKISRCRLMSFDTCSKVCAGAAADGHRWHIDDEPCTEIAKAFVSDKWMCRAVASVGTSRENGPWDHAGVDMLGSGNTRDEAYLQALRDCNAMSSTKKNQGWLSGAAVSGGDCTVTQCQPPGSPLMQ
jgi:hypothetical protein